MTPSGGDKAKAVGCVYAADGFAVLSAKHFVKLGQALRMPKMVSTVKPNPEKLVIAFRKAAKKLGCDKSEQRFQEALFAVGTQKIGDACKPRGPFSKRSRPVRSTNTSPEKKRRTKDDESATPAWTKNELKRAREIRAARHFDGKIDKELGRRAGSTKRP